MDQQESSNGTGSRNNSPAEDNDIEAVVSSIILSNFGEVKFHLFNLFIHAWKVRFLNIVVGGNRDSQAILVIAFKRCSKASRH